MPFADVHLFHCIECDGKIQVGRIEIHHVINAVFRHVIQYAFGEFPVRVNNRNPMARLDVRYHHVAQKRGFTCSCFPDHIDMVAPVVRFDAEHLAVVAEIRYGKRNDLVFHLLLNNRQSCRRLRLLCVDFRQHRHFHHQRRHVVYRGKLLRI